MGPDEGRVTGWGWDEKTRHYCYFKGGKRIDTPFKRGQYMAVEGEVAALLGLFGNTDEGFATALEFLSEQARVAQETNNG